MFTSYSIALKHVDRVLLGNGQLHVLKEAKVSNLALSERFQAEYLTNCLVSNNLGGVVINSNFSLT